jgi:hypothetical protein
MRQELISPARLTESAAPTTAALNRGWSILSESSIQKAFETPQDHGHAWTDELSNQCRRSQPLYFKYQVTIVRRSPDRVYPDVQPGCFFPEDLQLLIPDDTCHSLHMTPVDECHFQKARLSLRSRRTRSCV